MTSRLKQLLGLDARECAARLEARLKRLERVVAVREALAIQPRNP